MMRGKSDDELRRGYSKEQRIDDDDGVSQGGGTQIPYDKDVSEKNYDKRHL